MISYTFTFDNEISFTLLLDSTATEAEVRTQVDYEVSAGYHAGVDSSNTYTITKG